MLAVKLNTNTEFAISGALLHDIADIEMDRDMPNHERISLDIATDLLFKAGFGKSDLKILTNEIIEPHSCDTKLPESIEAKIVATADAAAHFNTKIFFDDVRIELMPKYLAIKTVFNLK